jgi:hypothetical protein
LIHFETIKWQTNSIENKVLIYTMAGTSEIDVKCIKCKREYQAQVVDHVDLSVDRDLIKGLKRGKANRVQCPKCRKVQYLQRSIIINFAPQNRIVAYDPTAKSKKDLESLIKEYQDIISFNETLSEVGEEIEFKAIKDVKELKKLVREYAKLYT